MKNYEILEHTADLKIQAFGKDLPEAFLNLAQGVASQQADLKILEPDGEFKEISLEAADLKTLLVDWLNEILYQGEINQKVYFLFEVLEFSEEPAKIKTRMGGVKVPQKNIEVKAATYHDLEIKKTNSYWEILVIFDI